jgi:hypothetical protein
MSSRLITCFPCMAFQQFGTIGGRTAITDERTCTCPPAEPEPDLLALPNDCTDCGKPIKRGAKRCVPCGHAWNDRRDRFARKGRCLDCSTPLKDARAIRCKPHAIEAERKRSQLTAAERKREQRARAKVAT